LELRTIPQSLLPLAKYYLFLYFAQAGFPYIYIDALHCYVDKSHVVLAFFLLSAALDYFVSNNRYLKQSGWGRSVASVLTVELFCLVLFAQYHFVLALLLLPALAAFSVWCYRTLCTPRREVKRYWKYRMLCREKTVALLCCFSAVALVVPSVVGVYREEKLKVSSKEWQLLVELYNESVETEGEPSFFDRHRATLDGLKQWETLSRGERLELLSQVGLMEEEYLGVETDVPIVISSIKMEAHTCAYYSNDTKQLRINVEHIDNADLPSVIDTVLHEVYHAFQNNVVDRLDFDEGMVHDSYYFVRARAWRDNRDNYISAYSDFDAYEAQPLEADARNYAANRSLEYILQMQPSTDQ